MLATCDETPAVALIDWNMPVMDGLQFVQAVRPMAEYKRMTLMMVTTESEHGQIVRALAAGAHEYLLKPFGADALRFAMAYTSTGGQDIRWDARRVEMGRNFSTKLWNATRFAFMNFGEAVPSTENVTPQTLADRWILSRLQRAVEAVTGHLNAYDLGAATRTAYDFVWSEFCDWYLEAAKPELRAENAATKAVLAKTLTDILKLLHPLVPFITSELYEAMGHEEQLGRASWPQVNPDLIDEAAERDFVRLQNAVTGVRNLRTEGNLPPSQEVSVFAGGAGAERTGLGPTFAAAGREDSVVGVCA